MSHSDLLCWPSAATRPAFGSLPHFASPRKKKKKKRSCTGALSEWAHFLQRSCHMAVNYAFGGAAGSVRRTPALPVNSIRYHRLSLKRACRVESNMAARSFSMRETWVWESGCDHPKPRRHVDEDQLGYQMLLKGTGMSLMTAEEKEKVIRVFFISHFARFNLPRQIKCFLNTLDLSHVSFWKNSS